MVERDAWRFWAKVLPAESGCWHWTASADGDRYGHLWLDGKLRKASRIAFELCNGSIPRGLWVLHKCDNPLCVNPAHLFLGTAADNRRDMYEKNRNDRPSRRITHCVKGHEFTPQNIYWTTSATGYPARRCRMCQRIYSQTARRAVSRCGPVTHEGT